MSRLETGGRSMVQVARPLNKVDENGNISIPYK